MIRRTVVLCMLYATPLSAAAQLITIRTLPVSQGEQFNFLPSQNFGMGGVSLALNDTLLDPFANPAKGARLRFSQLMGSPTTYSVSDEAGGGRTLPLGAFTRGRSWFGVLWLALQEVDAAAVNDFPGGVFFPGGDPLGRPVAENNVQDPDGLLAGLDANSHTNSFAFLSLGKTDSGRGLTVAGSAMWSRLRAVDGVDLLYSGSAGVRQEGQALDVRLGVMREWAGGRSLEGVLLFDRYDMTHDVTYLDQFWDPGLLTFGARTRLDRNPDRTYTLGAHVAYTKPLTDTTWRVGWIATMNHMTHPKIPNYSIMAIPRDPGNSNAFNLGVGLSRTRGTTTWGIDVIFEPIWSHTWADAAVPVETVGGDTIPPGGMTIENHFRFNNAVLRLGVAADFADEQRVPSAGLQFGLAVRSISYRLEQYDHTQGQGRTQDESWIEWAPTWGVLLRLTGLELRYQGSATHGTGRPGVSSGDEVLTAPQRDGGGILAAPSGPLSLGEVRVMTHRFSVTVPLR